MKWVAARRRCRERRTRRRGSGDGRGRKVCQGYWEGEEILYFQRMIFFQLACELCSCTPSG